MPRSLISSSALTFVIAAAHLVGCATDDDPPPTYTDTDVGTTTSTTSGSSGGATTTGSSTETTGTGTGTGGQVVPTLSCPTPVTPSGPFGSPPPQSFDSVLDPLTLPDVCDGLSMFNPGRLDVYLPGDGNGNPAPGRFPVLVFHRGRGLDYAEYEYLFDALQALGIVALNVDAGAGSFTELAAINAMQCSLRWFYFASGLFEDHGTCQLIVAGHSHGALSAHGMLETLGDASQEPYLSQVGVTAEVLLAPGNSGAPIYTAEQAVPFLALGTSTDEDVPGQVLTVYDPHRPRNDVDTSHCRSSSVQGRSVALRRAAPGLRWRWHCEWRFA